MGLLLRRIAEVVPPAPHPSAMVRGPKVLWYLQTEREWGGTIQYNALDPSSHACKSGSRPAKNSLARPGRSQSLAPKPTYLCVPFVGGSVGGPLVSPMSTNDQNNGSISSLSYNLEVLPGFRSFFVVFRGWIDRIPRRIPYFR